MTRGNRILPYRTADESVLISETWWYESSGTRIPLPKYLPGWDYATELVAGLTATIDADLLQSSTAVEDLGSLALVIVCDCKASQRRFTSLSRLYQGCQVVDIALSVPAGELADVIDLSATLILAEDIEPVPDRVRRAGSRLATSSTITVVLEGDASRFPTEPLSFSAAGYEAAPWTVSSTAESLDDSLMGSVRLLINEDHSWGQQLLDDAGSPISSQLRVDVFRSLVSICADLTADAGSSFEDDSLGGVSEYMSQLYLRRSLAETVRMAKEEPLRFDRLVYEAVTS